MIEISLFKHPRNIISGVFLALIFAFISSYLLKDLFYKVTDFTIGSPILRGYPKRLDLFFAICLMVFFPISAYLSDKIFNRYWSKSEPRAKSTRCWLYIAPQIKSIIKYHLSCFMLGLMALYGLLTLLFKGFFIVIEPENIIFALAIYVIFSFSSLAFILKARTKLNFDYAKKIYGRIMIFAQFLCLSLLAAFLPTPYQIEPEIFKYSYLISENIYFLIAGFAFLALLDLLYRIKLHHSGCAKLSRLVSPISLSFGLILLFPNAPFSSLASDDYHWGEILLPFFLYKEYGTIPYIDYILAHGFSNMLPSIFTDIFTDKLTAQNILYGQFLAHSLIMIISFCVIAYLFTPLLALFPVSLMLFFPYVPVIYLMAFNVLFASLFSPKIFRNPFLWLIYYGFIGLALVLFNIGTGSALVISALPMAFYVIYKIIKHRLYREKTNIIIAALALIIIGSLLIFTPIFDISMGIINILLENSSINLNGFGTLWSDSSKNSFIFLLLQNIWIFLVPIFFIWSMNLFSSKQNPLNAFMLLGFALFAIIIMPYALGRIGLENLSRTGRISIMFIFIFLPALIYNIRSSQHNYYRNIAMLALFVAIFISVTNKDDRTFSYLANILNPTFHQKQFSETESQKQIISSDYGLENIGNIVIDKAHLDRLLRIKTVLNKYLNENDSYLDLTNRNAHYFYLKRKLLLESGAYYNMAHSKQHHRSVARLKENPPKLILIKADNLILDGLELSLRTYPIYRHILLEEYSAIAEKNLVFMLRKDIYDEYFKGQAQDINLLSDNIGVVDLQNISVSWGYSYDVLKSKLSFVAPIDNLFASNSVESNANGYKVTGDNPYIGFDISKQAINGKDAGVIMLDITCDKSQKFAGKIYYTNDLYYDFNEAQTYQFQLKNGINIIPVDLNPKWLLGGDIDAIRLDIIDKNSCDIFKINHFSLYKRDLLMNL